MAITRQEEMRASSAPLALPALVVFHQVPVVIVNSVWLDPQALSPVQPTWTAQCLEPTRIVMAQLVKVSFKQGSKACALKASIEAQVGAYPAQAATIAAGIPKRQSVQDTTLQKEM